MVSMAGKLDDTSRARALRLTAELTDALHDAYGEGAPRPEIEKLCAAQGWLRLVFEEPDVDARLRWIEKAEQTLAAWKSRKR